GLFPQIGEDLKDMKLGSRYAIITDSNVGKLYSEDLRKVLKGNDLNADVFTFKAGERRKTNGTCEKIIDAMSEYGYGRDSAILALGGGVVGDMAGFIAATFNRGVPYIQIPTTLLAQADSSIGGKTAVNTKHGKNLMGAFKQPYKVYIDVSTLKTLPDRDFRSGLAETIKHGVIQDRDFFDFLGANYGSILERLPDYMLYIAKKNCEIKGSVVERDPHEKGERRILNYGHTPGHALEKLSGYYLTHGEGVAIGMMVVARIAESLDYVESAFVDAQERILENVGLPTQFPNKIPGIIPFINRRISDKEIIEVTSMDKKTKGGEVRYVLPAAIGKMHDFGGEYAAPVGNDVVTAALRATRYR
ncbi:MAG: 3-dehydroquinate synthase, partial [Candidatus Aenigmatarchaeota archaeon]